MAFLCPVRIRRGKKKKSSSIELDKDLSRPGSVGGLNHTMGRITGSASIETLVRVGIEKEHGLSPDSKMIVLHDFTPCVDDELEVKRGQIVNILYRENDWVYVIGQDSRQEGFIPYSYCAPYNNNTHMADIKKKLPRELPNDLTDGTDGPQTIGNSNIKQEESTGHNLGGVLSGSSGLQSPLKQSQASLQSSEPDFLPFSKDPSGVHIVLYTFIARDENDVSVERGEFVTVLNREDPDWFWIVRSDGNEGFIPSGFVYPADNVLQQGKLNGNGNSMTTTSLQHNENNASSNSLINQANSGNNTMVTTLPNSVNTNSLQSTSNAQIVGTDDLRYHGTELVMLYDYKQQAPDDLTCRRGDWIYADLNNQTVDGWLWAFSPKTRKYGFIPKAYARPPAMTSL